MEVVVVVVEELAHACVPLGPAPGPGYLREGRIRSICVKARTS